MKVKNSRNAFIELFRFLAAVSIVAYHYEFVYKGKSIYLQHFYIWVEFFFILSGFFIAANAMKKSEIDSIDFMINEFKKLYPIYVIGFCISFIVYHMTGAGEFKHILASLWDSKNELFLLNMFVPDTGNPIMNLGGPPQYIGTLLLCTLILHFLVTKHRNIYVAVIGPLAVIIGYLHIYNLYGNISQWMAYNGFLYVGIIRGFAGMSLGALAYLVLLPRMKNVNCNTRKAILLGILVFISFLILFDECIKYEDLIFYVLIFCVLIVVGYIDDFNIDAKYKAFINMLGKLSYPMFVLHYPILKVIATYFPNKGYWGMLLLCESVVLICSALLQFGVLKNLITQSPT